MAQKIDLENFIFARAHKIGAQIYARLGRLYTAHPDACLCRLVDVYNAFFGEINCQAYCTGENVLEGYHTFWKQREHIAGKCIVWDTRNYKFEMLC
mgnify:CR=1 FL=1